MFFNSFFRYFLYLTGTKFILAPQFTQLDKDDILITLDFDHSKRQITGTKQGLATETFKDLRSTFTPEQVQTEAKRCLDVAQV